MSGGASSRRKGAVAEREAAAWLVDWLGADMVERRRASDQSAEGGFDILVKTSPPIAVEVKRTEKASPRAWLDQARMNAPPDHMAAVMWRASRHGWCFIVCGEDMATMLREMVP